MRAFITNANHMEISQSVGAEEKKNIFVESSFCFLSFLYLIKKYILNTFPGLFDCKPERETNGENGSNRIDKSKGAPSGFAQYVI